MTEYEQALGRVNRDCIKRLKFQLRTYFAMRGEGIVKSFDGGFVYPKDEIKRLIKHIRERDGTSKT